MNLAVPTTPESLPPWYESVAAVLRLLPVRLAGLIKTTGTTPAVIKSVAVEPGLVMVFQWTILARQHAGSSGTVGDGLAHIGQAAFHLVGGTATLVGSINASLYVKDQAAWAMTVAGSGNQAQWTVAGAANTEVNWSINMTVSLQG